MTTEGPAPSVVMRRVAVVVVAALLVAFVADLLFARLVEQVVAREVEERTGARAATVDIRSFPLAESLFRKGEVREVTVRLEDVVSNGLPLVEVTLTGVDVAMDRSDAISGNLRITRVGRADLVVEIAEEDLSAVFGVEVDLEIDRLTVSVDGEPTPLGSPVVEGRELVLEAEMGRLSLPLPGEDFLPCEPNPVVLDDRLGLVCSTDELPDAFGGVAGGAVTPEELDDVELVDPVTEDRSQDDIPDRLGRAEADDSDE